MNAVASLSRAFPCDALTLYAALTDRDGWWGEDEPATEVAAAPGEKVTLEVPVAGEPTRAMLVLSPAGPEPTGGTALQVLHTRFADGATRDAHAALWEVRLDRLEAILSGR